MWQGMFSVCGETVSDERMRDKRGCDERAFAMKEDER